MYAININASSSLSNLTKSLIVNDADLMVGFCRNFSITPELNEDSLFDIPFVGSKSNDEKYISLVECSRCIDSVDNLLTPSSSKFHVLQNSPSEIDIKKIAKKYPELVVVKDENDNSYIGVCGTHEQECYLSDISGAYIVIDGISPL